MTDHYLLMTATPHKGDPENFCLFLALLDRDVYGNVKSLEEAMRRHEAPFYLRRTKEALVTFPDPETGEVKKLFTKREVQTTDVRARRRRVRLLRRADPLRRGPVDQGRGATTRRAGRAVGFTMAMLQRRIASSIYAVRRSLERMRDEAREDPGRPGGVPAGSRSSGGSPTTSTTCPRTSSSEIIAPARRTRSPRSTRPRCARRSRSLGKLIDQARGLEKREIEIEARQAARAS